MPIASRPTTRLARLCLCACLLVGGSATARADDASSRNRDEALRLFQAGTEALKTLDMAEARARLAESLALYPHAATSFNLAVALRGLGDLVGALVQLESLRDGKLGTLPPNVRVERWIALDSIRRHTLVAAGHGGFGTTVYWVLRGVPVVVLPMLGDNFVNADCVSRAGVGVALTRLPSFSAALRDGPRVVATEFASAVLRVLQDPSFARRAAQIAEAAAALPPVDASVETLRTIAARTGCASGR